VLAGPARPGFFFWKPVLLGPKLTAVYRCKLASWAMPNLCFFLTSKEIWKRNSNSAGIPAELASSSLCELVTPNR